MKHTEGPLKIDIDLEAIFPIDGRKEFVFEITNRDHSETTGYATNKANAQHLCACWNACEGLNPEAVPDLLRICIRLAEFRAHNASSISLCRLCAEAKQAIAKARD